MKWRALQGEGGAGERFVLGEGGTSLRKAAVRPARKPRGRSVPAAPERRSAPPAAHNENSVRTPAHACRMRGRVLSLGIQYAITRGADYHEEATRTARGARRGRTLYARRAHRAHRRAGGAAHKRRPYQRGQHIPGQVLRPHTARQSDDAVQPAQLRAGGVRNTGGLVQQRAVHRRHRVQHSDRHCAGDTRQAHHRAAEGGERANRPGRARGAGERDSRGGAGAGRHRHLAKRNADKRRLRGG